MEGGSNITSIYSIICLTIYNKPKKINIIIINFYELVKPYFHAALLFLMYTQRIRLAGKILSTDRIILHTKIYFTVIIIFD